MIASQMPITNAMQLSGGALAETSSSNWSLANERAAGAVPLQHLVDSDKSRRRIPPFIIDAATLHCIVNIRTIALLVTPSGGSHRTSEANLTVSAQSPSTSTIVVQDPPGSFTRCLSGAAFAGGESCDGRPADSRHGWAARRRQSTLPRLARDATSFGRDSCMSRPL